MSARVNAEHESTPHMRALRLFVRSHSDSIGISETSFTTPLGLSITSQEESYHGPQCS